MGNVRGRSDNAAPYQFCGFKGSYSAPDVRELCHSTSPAIDTVELHVTNNLAFPPDIPFELVASLNATRREKPTLALLEAPDIARETELIAVRVRALIDSGARPSRIAIFYREARPGVDATATTLATLGVPVTARRRTALSTTGPARTISTLLGGAIAQWSRPSSHCSPPVSPPTC